MLFGCEFGEDAERAIQREAGFEQGRELAGQAFDVLGLQATLSPARELGREPPGRAGLERQQPFGLQARDQAPSSAASCSPSTSSPSSLTAL